MGGAVLAVTAGFIGWVLGVAGAGLVDAAAVTRTVPLRLRPPPAVALQGLVRRPGSTATPDRQTDGALQVTEVRGLDGPWQDRRALIRIDEAPVRSHGVGDLLAEGSVLVAVERGGIWRFTPDDRLEWLATGGESRVLDDFVLPPARRSVALPPPDPALVAAVQDTLHLAGHGPADQAQVAFDALVGAGEPMLRFLAPRAASLAPLPGVAIRRPSGRRAVPRFEGELVQWLLQAITRERFTSSTDGPPSAEAMLESGWAWQSYLGVLQPASGP